MEKLAGRPLTRDGLVANLLVDVQVTLADLYKARELNSVSKQMLITASEKVWHAQALSHGIEKNSQFNERVLELLGEEKKC